MKNNLNWKSICYTLSKIKCKQSIIKFQWILQPQKTVSRVKNHINEYPFYKPCQCVFVCFSIGAIPLITLWDSKNGPSANTLFYSALSNGHLTHN